MASEATVTKPIMKAEIWLCPLTSIKQNSYWRMGPMRSVELIKSHGNVIKGTWAMT